MQVRKFEAKTMQEALSMVKRQLGPEAIILAAKDNSKGFGLGGESSVEVTAAVSAHKLKEHEYAMSRLRDRDKEQIFQGTIGAQRKFIEKSVSRFKEEPRPAITSARYASIQDEELEERAKEELVPSSKTTTKVSNSYQTQGNLSRMRSLISGAVEKEELAPPTGNASATERVKQATQSAWKAFAKDWGEPEGVKTQTPATQGSLASSGAEVEELKKQIEQLQKVIASFQKVPQTFVGGHPGAKYEIPYELSFLFEKLVKKGIDEKLAADLVLEAKRKVDPHRWEKRGILEAFTARKIMEQLSVETEISQGVHVFLGAPGCGKTSSLIKCASRLVVKERKKVAILTTDTWKLGASEQLRIYARILNVPFAIIQDRKDWGQIANELHDVDVILVDTPGVSCRNAEEVEMIEKGIPERLLESVQLHFVQSVSRKNREAEEAFQRFSRFPISDVVFTKLDESTQHGLIYNLSYRYQLPVLAFSTGANVPEDFEYASVERVVDLLFDLSKVGS